MSLKSLSTICFLFFLYIILSYIYIGITTVPSEGDSLNYHLPIAKAYLDGSVVIPEKILGVPYLKYSPGASEGILAILLFLHIPANLFNVFGLIFFFTSLYYLARKFGFEKNYSIIFASGVATLNGLVRWLDTQIIDIYLASFFVVALGLLQKPEKKMSYFLKLGFVLGMLAGSKFSGLLFVGVICIVFSKKIIAVLSLKRFIVFSILFFLFGLSWYLRNYIATGNPMYPQGFLFFKGHDFGILNSQVWRVSSTSLYGLFGTVNALISEYMIWVLVIPLIVVYYSTKIFRENKLDIKGLLFLTFVGILNLCIYFFLPSDYKNHIMVSVIRYSYPAFIPFILGVFLIAKKLKKEALLSIAIISNMFFVSFPMSYNPKVIFIFIPLALLFYYYRFRK